jgi:hypothetical protein
MTLSLLLLPNGIVSVAPAAVTPGSARSARNASSVKARSLASSP